MCNIFINDMGYSEYYKKEETKMNLGKKYKQLFEGKIRSNDVTLINENAALKFMDKGAPLLDKDKELKRLGMEMSPAFVSPNMVQLRFKSGAAKRNINDIKRVLLYNHLGGHADKGNTGWSEIKLEGDDVFIIFNGSKTTSSSKGTVATSEQVDPEQYIDVNKMRQINNVDSRGEMNMYEDGEEITVPLKKPIQGKKEFTATVDADAGFTSFSFETEDQEAMESVGIDIDDLSDFMTDSMF